LKAKTQEAVPDTPAATLECDEKAIQALTAAYELLGAAEQELERCARAQQHLLMEISRISPRVAESKNLRFRELIKLYSEQPEPKYPDDGGAPDRVRLSVSDGVLQHLVQYHLPEVQRAATRCQVSVLRAQSSVARSIGEYRKIRLAEKLVPVAEFEGDLEINAATLRTTRVLALGDNLEAAAYRLEKRNEEFQRQADQGQPRCGAFEPRLELTSEFNALFFVEEK
jgi:hypothetical protein